MTTTTNGHQSAENPALPPDLQRRVDEATAATQEANARAAEAAARSAETKADSDATTARIAELKSFVPDVGPATKSTLDVKDATPMWNSLLTYAALEKIGASVADRILSALPEAAGTSILVTGDADLSTSDATYEEVTTGLEQLERAAEALCADLERPKETPRAERMAPAAAIQLAAAAVPAVLSIFSTESTLSTGATESSDLAAAAPIAGALHGRGISVVHDGFRLIPGGGVFNRLTNVERDRSRLATWQLTLSDHKSGIDKQLAELRAAKDPNEHRIAELTEEATDNATRLGEIKNILTAIDTFLASVRAIPKGATHSPLTTAALHEELHGEKRRFGYVLLVKAHAGQSQGEITHHPFLRWIVDDKFSTSADISVTYMLIETKSSSLIIAGTVTGVVLAHGSIGERPTVDEPVILM
jgi:hypothetical protein